MRVAVHLFAAASGSALCVLADLGLDAVYHKPLLTVLQRGAGRTNCMGLPAASKNPWACGAVLVVGRFTMLKRRTA